MRYKSDKERKETLVNFRLNQGERKQLELLSKSTGQSFSGIFRERVLNLEEFPKYNPPAWQARFHRKWLAIARRGDIGDTEKLRLLSEMLVQLEQRGLKMQERFHRKMQERQTVTKRHRGRRSA